MSARKILWRQVKHHWEIYLLILPAIILVTLFVYYPATNGIVHSFFRWNASDISEFVGFANYLDLVQSSEFWDSFGLAFFLGFWNIVKMVPALLVAVLIHRCSSGKMQFFYRVLFVTPMVIPPLIIVLVWRAFFFEATNGLLNRFLEFSNIKALLVAMDGFFHWGGLFTEHSNPAWLGDPRLIIAAVVIWGFPWVSSFAVLTHLAKLQGIDKSVYEAAEIDGVNWFTKFTTIELPSIMGSVYIHLVFMIIRTIRDAGMIIALAGVEGGPGGAATVPALFMFRKAFLDQKMGYACAVGLVLTLIIMGFQKVSSYGMNWRERTRNEKIGFRIGLGLAGLLFILLANTYEFVPEGADLFGTIMLFLAVVGTPLKMTFLRTIKTPVEFILRLAVAAGGIGVIYYVYSTVPSWSYYMLGGLLVLAGLPTPLVLVPLANLIQKIKMWFNEQFRVDPELRYQQRMMRREQPLYKFLNKTGDMLLRVSKHATIWIIAIFAMIPIYLMVIVSVKTNQQFYVEPLVLTFPTHFVENWSSAWNMMAANVANSIYISTLGVVLVLAFGLAAAYFFVRLKMPLSSFMWNAILILMMMPMIANMVPLFILIRDMGMLNKLTTLIIIGAAEGQVGAIFVFRNFVEDVPRPLFEAAEMDGANHLQQLRNVVFPLSGPVLGTVGIQNFVVQWQSFLMPLVIMRDSAKLPITVQLLRLAGEYFKLWGPLMAGYALAAIPLIVLFTLALRLFVKGLTEGSVK